MDAWAAVNPQKPPIAFEPRAPIVPGPPPQSITTQAAVGSVYDVHASQRDMVEKQLSDLAAGGQKVLTCQYGPRNTTSTEGFKDYSFWYPGPPADVLKYMLIRL